VPDESFECDIDSRASLTTRNEMASLKYSQVFSMFSRQRQDVNSSRTHGIVTGEFRVDLNTEEGDG